MIFPKFRPQFSTLRLFPNFLLGLGLLTFSPSEAIANSVEIRNYQSLGNKVTLKVKVFDRQNNFVEGLQKQDFTLETRDENGKKTELTSQNLNLIQPQNQRSREPAYVLFLVDISGSMAQKDSSGTEKLTGAVTAIEKFIQQAQSENFPIYVEIVPFGYTNSSNCFVKPKHQVDKDNIVIDYAFTDINDENIYDKLSELREISPCASTNLAKPLEAGASFLEQKYQENENSRLMMVLLSDGFDNSSKNQIEKISQNLQKFPLTVHTLGYGESLVQLRNRAQGKKGGKCNISEQELNPQNLAKNCQLPV